MMSEILSITVENVKGLESAELNLGKPQPGKGRMYVLKGANGVGKTSFLAAINGLFAGGFHPELIREGASKARISAVLSDETVIERTITAKGAYPKVTQADASAPPKKGIETWLKSLASGVGFDPLSFCEMDRKERLDYLLKVMPLDFTQAELLKALKGVAVEKLAGGDIRYVDGIVRDLTARRGSTGSRRDEKADLVEGLRKTLLQSDQGDAPKDWRTSLADLERRRREESDSQAAEIAAVTREWRTLEATIAQEAFEAETEARKQFQILLDMAKEGQVPERDGADGADADGFISAMAEVGWPLGTLADKKAHLAEISRDAQLRIDQIRAESATRTQALSFVIAEAQSGFEQQSRAAGTRELMEKTRREAAALTKEWDALAEAIRELGKLRQSKLANLPIEGVSIGDDGAVLVDGRDFDELNTGAQYMKSLEIGAVGVGELGLLFVDKLEHLDAANQALLRESVEASGLTVIAALVSDGPLRSEPPRALTLFPGAA